MDENMEKKVDNLIFSMTLEEKIGQLHMIEIHRLMEEPWSDEREEVWNYINKDLNQQALKRVIIDYNIGFIFYGGTGLLKDNNIDDWRDVYYQIKSITQKTRLKLPVMHGLDAIHGFNYLSDATIYPHNLGMVATWNPDWAYQQALETSKELRYAGMHSVFAPNADIARDPRWSRVYESSGEDPYLASQFIGNYVAGFHDKARISACVKHFLAYGEAVAGKDREPSDVSERTIREIHIPSFQAAVQAGTQMIMLSSGSVNGIPVHMHRWLLQDILRMELNYKGLIVSDWADIRKIYSYHKVTESVQEAIVRSFNAGVDLNMVPDDLKIIDIMIDAAKKGLISMERINQSVKRVLSVKYKFGLFEAEKQKKVQIGSAKSRKLAYTIAAESVVMLKNNGVLPLKKPIKTVLVIGEAAETRRHLCGGWTMGWNLVDEDSIRSGNTFIESIRNKLNESQIIFMKDLNELRKSRNQADYTILFLTEEPYAESGCDLPDLTLSEDQQLLLEETSLRHKNIIIVSITGRPLLIKDAVSKADAFLWSCFPGTQGGEAIIDILLGKINPSGKLPVTFPKSTGNLPSLYNSRNTATYDPFYPFGYGLSYTKFRYVRIQVPKMLKKEDNLKIGIKIANTGEYDGKEVIQIWGSHLFFSCIGLRKELMAFQKVFLKSHEEIEIDIVIDKKNLLILDINNNRKYEPHLLQLEIDRQVFDVRLC